MITIARTSYWYLKFVSYSLNQERQKKRKKKETRIRIDIKSKLSERVAPTLNSRQKFENNLKKQTNDFETRESESTFSQF